MACTRRVRRLSSSTSVSILRRRRMNRLRAVRLRSADVAAIDQLAEVLPVLLRSGASSVLQVVRHAGDDLLLGQPLGQRDLDRAVEGQDAAVDLDQRADRGPHRQVAADHRAAEPLAGDLDLLGQGDFLFAASTAESRPSAIRYMRIGSLLHLVTSAGGGSGIGRFAGASPSARCSSPAVAAIRLGCGDVVELRRRRLVHQVDALFLQGDQQIVELVGIDFFVGQVVVDLVVGQITLGLCPWRPVPANPCRIGPPVDSLPTPE